MATTATPDEFLILDAAAIEGVLSPRACRAAIGAAYRALADAPDAAPKSMGFCVDRGKLHVKASVMPGAGRYFAAKINANFPGNPERGLPTIQGVIALFSTGDGRPLALLQSGALTGLRTAATAALAAHYGARRESSRLAIIGAGAQARYQLEAMADGFPLREVCVVDLDRDRADALARFAADRLGLAARVETSPAEAFANADIAATLTPATTPFVREAMLRAGLFVAAMGADNPDKNEIAAEVFRHARVFADDADQCVKEGDLAHAIRAGTARREGVPGLGEIVSGAARARLADDDVVIFDSTGSGLQDVAAAAAAYEAAVAAGRGVRMRLE